jgi:hypothetical protein
MTLLLTIAVALLALGLLLCARRLAKLQRDVDTLTQIERERLQRVEDYRHG